MAITLSTTFADALLSHDATAAQSAAADQLGSGSLKLYASGSTPPAGPNEAVVGTVLATFTFGANTAFSAASGGSLTLDIPTTTVTASASGTADYFRILSSGGTALIQGSAGASGADWNLSSTGITSGDNVSVTGTPTLSFPVS